MDTVHNMKLHHAPFDMIRRGEKTIELRLYDEKRRLIEVGDRIVFTDTSTGETLRAALVGVRIHARGRRTSNPGRHGSVLLCRGAEAIRRRRHRTLLTGKGLE